MVMKRIKIRYAGNDDDDDGGGNDDKSSSIAKVLRFDESTGFIDLIRMIVVKLGLSSTKNNKIYDDESQDLSEQFELWLGGESLLEATDEIDHGDEVVLVKKMEKTSSTNSSTRSNPTQRVPSNSAAAATAAGGDGENDDSDDEDTKVEDVTEQCQKQSQQSKRKFVDLLSSGEDDDEEDEGDDEEDGSIAEGSDAWDESSSSDHDDSDDSDFDEDEEDKKPSARKHKAKLPPRESPLQVLMDEKDVPAAPGKRDGTEPEDTSPPAGGGDYDLEEVSTLVDGAGRKKADRAVKDRIIKLLNTGFHDQSNENEAKNAMKLAQRLMHKHNLSQALLLKERQETNKKEQSGNNNGNDDEILKGGTVTVRIVQRKTGQPALLARWLSQLTHPITDNFQVKCYHTTVRGKKCSVTFYGIYTNAQLAAYAYRVAAERISQMAACYLPETQKEPSWRSSISSNNMSISTKSARLSYAMGVVEGISKDVERNIQLDRERRLRKLERLRLVVSTGAAYEESDNEGDDDDDDDDDKDGPGFSFPNPANDMEEDKKPAAKQVSTVNSDVEDNHDHVHGETDTSNIHHQRKTTKTQVHSCRRLEELEKEQEAAIVLVDHREKIAEQVLEEQGIKLSKGRENKAISFDRRSYQQGIEDAKEIDINQRAIRDEVKVKRERKSK